MNWKNTHKMVLQCGDGDVTQVEVVLTRGVLGTRVRQMCCGYWRHQPSLKKQGFI